jgi:predicted nucleic acid-binding protein
MASLLVDTNVVSYLLKRDTRGMIYRPHLHRNDLFISFATVAELYRWAIRYGWKGSRRDKLRRDIVHYAILNFDDALAWRWAEVMSIPGQPMEPGDAWVAATALRYDLPLVTHNRRHFEHLPGLRIISEAP